MTGNPHSKTTMDQVIEITINRSSKETSGLTAKVENPGSCARWKRTNHFLVALREYQNKILRKSRNERQKCCFRS